MLSKSLTIGIGLAVMMGLGGVSAWAEDSPAALAKALPEATISLDQALKASEHEGTPISGKFELDDGALQLSVYTMKGDKFTEVVIDHKSGTVKKAEPITDADDLKNAKGQGDAIGKGKTPLSAAIANAVKANGGYRAVSAMPALEGGHPVASITLMKGEDVKKVTEKLD